jgi:CRP-like cAMP-binding protein
MADLRALKDQAADLAAKGKLDRAVTAYRKVLAADRRDVSSRQRLADALRRADRLDEALAEYAAVAEQYAHDGQLAKSIAICKTILELDPAHGTTQATLAELYAMRSRTDRADQSRRRLTSTGVPAVLLPTAGDRGLRVVALAPEADEANMALPLAPVPLAARSATHPAPAAQPVPPRAPVPGVVTPLSQILAAARTASEAGVEEEIVLDLDDEPLGLAEEPVLVGAPEPAEEPATADEPALLAAAEEAEPPELTPEAEAPEGDLADDAILEAGPEADAGPAPGRSGGLPVRTDVALPRVPLFGDLSREAFLAVTEAMVLHRVAAGDPVIQEGESGASFFVVASGHLAVSKRNDVGDSVRLARLSAGDFFGEMALLSGAPRQATVTAEEEAEVLELRAETLLELSARHPHLATSLRRFYRQRLLANTMAMSPVFRPFSREDRREVIARFRSREVSAGEVILREGQPSDGLYVVLDGALDVWRHRGASEVPVAELREGDVFGEMSCLRKAPATATVAARRAGTLLRLPRAGFDELVLSHPQVLEVVSELTEERAENLDAILSGRAQWTEEGLVLI